MKNDKKTQKQMRDTCYEIWKISSELKGLGSLFLYQSRDVCLEAEELSGLGHLLQCLSTDLEGLQSSLRDSLD